MGWGAAIAALLKIILIGLSALVERNKDIREAKKEALKEAKDGLKNRDAARIINAFDRVRRL